MRFAGQPLDVVEVGELAGVAGRGELPELAKGLAAEVGPVNQEQHPLRGGGQHQAVGQVGAMNVLPDPVAIWASARTWRIAAPLRPAVCPTARPCPVAMMNSHTATPWAAFRFILLRSCTTHPQATS